MSSFSCNGEGFQVMFHLVSLNLNRSRCKLLHTSENVAASTANNNTWSHEHHFVHFVSFAFCRLPSFTSIILILRITSYCFSNFIFFAFVMEISYVSSREKLNFYVIILFTSSCISVNDVLLIIIIIIIITASKHWMSHTNYCTFNTIIY